MDGIKVYFVTIPAHKFLHIKTTRVMILGFLAKAKSYPRTGFMKRYVVCLIALKAN